LVLICCYFVMARYRIFRSSQVGSAGFLGVPWQQSEPDSAATPPREGGLWQPGGFRLWSVPDGGWSRPEAMPIVANKRSANTHLDIGIRDALGYPRNGCARILCNATFTESGGVADGSRAREETGRANA
jgi:hypothetical protein